MDEASITALMETHHLNGGFTRNGYGRTGVERLADGRFKLTFDGMPNLGFFVALAALAGMPIESIKTDSEEHYGGCDTCGYGAGVEYFAYVTPSDGGRRRSIRRPSLLQGTRLKR